MKKKSSIKHIFRRLSFIVYRLSFSPPRLSFILFLSLSFIVYPLSFSLAVPQEMCIYYGQALDQYGWPYMNGADVILKSGTNEIVRHTITGSISPGVNFALYVSLDDGNGPEPYSDKALYAGDAIEIVVRDARGEVSIMRTNALPAVGIPGEVILVNVTAGTDSDGDGMSDEWEQELVDMSAALNSIEDVNPGDDFDGDGASNLHEFHSGNFAFIDYDYFFIEHIDYLENRIKLELLSVPGKAYYVSSRTNLMIGGWEKHPFSATENGVARVGLIEGDGDWLSFYVDTTNTTRFISLRVQ